MMMVLSLPPCVVAPFLISQCYNSVAADVPMPDVVAPFLISQCYNILPALDFNAMVVAPLYIGCSSLSHFAVLQ